MDGGLRKKKEMMQKNEDILGMGRERWDELGENGKRGNEVLRVQHSKSTGSSVDKYVTE